MLAIRMQRTGRKGYPTYRVIVQESHRQPTSGRVVANIGNYNPHTKEVKIDKEKAEFYLKNGAQPSDRVVYVFESEKIALPDWVKKTATDKQKSIKNLEKLRRNQPKEEVVAEEAPAAEAEVASDEIVEESSVTDEVAPEAEVSVEQIADAEVADGQESAEQELAAEVEENSEEESPNA